MVKWLNGWKRDISSWEPVAERRRENFNKVARYNGIIFVDDNFGDSAPAAQKWRNIIIIYHHRPARVGGDNFPIIRFGRGK